MKKIKFILLAVVLTTTITACHNGRHVSISADTNGAKTTLEYSGKIAFTADSLGIKSMAKESYISFESNGSKLVAQRNMDAITYQLNGGPKSNTLPDEGKQLMAEVLKRLHKINKE